MGDPFSTCIVMHRTLQMTSGKGSRAVPFLIRPHWRSLRHQCRLTVTLRLTIACDVLVSPPLLSLLPDAAPPVHVYRSTTSSLTHATPMLQVQGCCCGAGALQPPLREPFVSLLDFEQKCYKWWALLSPPMKTQADHDAAGRFGCHTVVSGKLCMHPSYAPCCVKKVTACRYGEGARAHFTAVVQQGIDALPAGSAPDLSTSSDQHQNGRADQPDKRQRTEAGGPSGAGSAWPAAAQLAQHLRQQVRPRCVLAALAISQHAVRGIASVAGRYFMSMTIRRSEERAVNLRNAIREAQTRMPRRTRPSGPPSLRCRTRLDRCLQSLPSSRRMTATAQTASVSQ